MRKIYIAIILSGVVLQATAQNPEDALRFSWNPQSGTARNMAIGGAMTGLGGEISAAHTNPAGLALYKTNEFVFSPGFVFLKNKAEYRGTSAANGKQSSGFNLGTSGVILAGGSRRTGLRGGAVGLTVNRLADFNYNLSYKGYNNVSSGAERYAEEFSASRLNIDDALNSRYLSLATRMALHTYLVDTMTIGGIKQVVAMPEFTTGVNQENTITSKGGITEFAGSAAFNMQDKFFLGVTLGMPVVNYTKEQTYKETDATTILNNRFGSYTYSDKQESAGYGFNLKAGFIYRPVERVRFGLAIHTPTVYTITDKLTGSMNANTENYNGNVNVTHTTFSNGAANIESKYSFISPWKISGGISYVFREVENVKKQRAFVTADIDYVTYRSMQYSAADENASQSDKNYYKSVTQNIKNIYRNAFNFRAGGEVKLNTIMVRLGSAYLGNPNKSSSDLKSNRILLSGGLGYRNKGLFIDLTYVHQLTKEVSFPYRLNDKPNTFAPVNGTGGGVMLTTGFKF
jgi:hypothetical protein